MVRNVGAAIARLHVALASCPFGIESWQVGPGLLEAWWQTAQDRLTAGAVTRLALAVALALIDYFLREHDLVEESWLRTACWIGDNFDALRLPAPAFGM